MAYLFPITSALLLDLVAASLLRFSVSLFLTVSSVSVTNVIFLAFFFLFSLSFFFRRIVAQKLHSTREIFQAFSHANVPSFSRDHIIPEMHNTYAYLEQIQRASNPQHQQRNLSIHPPRAIVARFASRAVALEARDKGMPGCLAKVTNYLGVDHFWRLAFRQTSRRQITTR